MNDAEMHRILDAVDIIDDAPPSLGLIVQPQRWVNRAACRGMNPELFYGERGANLAVAAAKAVCRTCPVTADCLAYALDNNEMWGVWGGCSISDRRAMRRGAPIAAGERSLPEIDHGTERGYRQHLRRCQIACADCRAAHTAKVLAGRASNKPSAA